MENNTEKEVEDCKRDVDLKDVVIFEGELVLKPVVVAQSGDPIDHPDVVLHSRGQAGTWLVGALLFCHAIGWNFKVGTGKG